MSNNESKPQDRYESMRTEGLVTSSSFMCEMNLEELPPPPPQELVDLVVAEARRRGELKRLDVDSDDYDCFDEELEAKLCIALSFPTPSLAASDMLAQLSNSESAAELRISSEMLVNLLPIPMPALNADSLARGPVLVAAGTDENADCSLSAIQISDTEAVLRVSGRLVADGLSPVVQINGTRHTALTFDRQGFCRAPSNVMTKLQSIATSREPAVQIAFRRRSPSHPACDGGFASAVWTSWDALIDDANLGVDEFVQRMNAIAICSSDLTGLAEWCQLIRTSVIEQWLFAPGGFAEATARSGFGPYLLGPILSVVLRRRVLSLRVERDVSPLVKFWANSCELLGNEGTAGLFSPECCEELVYKADTIEGIASDENVFASNVAGLAAKMVHTDQSLFWAAQSLEKISQERSLDKTQGPGTAARVVTVWENFVVGGVASKIIRSGYMLDFEYCLPEELDDELGHEFSSSFRQLLCKNRTRRWRRIALNPTVDRIRSLLGKGTLRGQSGGLALLTALRLAGRTSRNGFIQAVPPYVVATAAEVNGTITAVGSLPEKFELLREEGIRVACVPKSQHSFASEVAGDGLIVIAAARSTDFARQLQDNSLLRDVKDPRWWIWWLTPVGIAIAATALFLMCALGWSMAPRFTWQTAAVVYHKEQGFDRFENLSEKIFAAKENAGGTISLPAMMIALGVLGEGDRIGVDPMIVRTSIERLSSKPEGTQRGAKILSEVSAGELVAVMNAEDFEFVAEREQFLSALALNLGIDRDRLEIRLAPVVDYEDDRITTVHYDGKVFDHVGANGGTLWRSAALRGIDAETAIKTNPMEITFFTRLIDATTSDREGDSAQISFELNTSGFGVIPVTETGDSVELFIKCMPQSQWCPLAGMDDIGDISMSITTMVRRPMTDAKPGQITRTAIQAIYVNAYQDQSLRNKDSDWWGGRFHRGTVHGDLSVAFPSTAASGPRGGDVTEPEFKVEFATKESDRTEPVRKRVFRDGARDWIVMDEFCADWNEYKDANAFVQRFRASWELPSQPTN